MILFFRHKRKDDISPKNTWKYDIFFKCSEKMVFTRNLRLSMIFFVISEKMVFLFPRKHDIFSLDGKWKKMIFIEKRVEIWYFLYICVAVKSMALPYWQKKKKKKEQGCPCLEKINLGVTSLASPKKMMSCYWNTTLTDTLERAHEAATGDVLQEKVFLEIPQNSQETTCARASFWIRLQV